MKKAATTKENNTTEKAAVEKPTGLALLRMPFEDHQISKLPKPTKQQTEIVKDNFQKGIRCKLCGAWHHPDVIHLDYVGHAALTDRLLDTDPNWSWEPMSYKDGSPAFDSNGGLWIKLTVCGVSRLGYGHAGDKKGGDAIKEVIGDALRNAAMRFGAALDLWHKGDLHKPDDGDGATAQQTTKDSAQKTTETEINPADYVVTFGKFKDMRLRDLLLNEIDGYIQYLEAGSVKTNKPLTGGPLAFVENAKKYLMEQAEIVDPHGSPEFKNDEINY